MYLIVLYAIYRLYTERTIRDETASSHQGASFPNSHTHHEFIMAT